MKSGNRNQKMKKIKRKEMGKHVLGPIPSLSAHLWFNPAWPTQIIFSFLFLGRLLMGPLVGLTPGALGGGLPCHCHVGPVHRDHPHPHADSNKMGWQSHVARVLRELDRIRLGVVRIRFLVTIYIYISQSSLSSVTPKHLENTITIAERGHIAVIGEAPDRNHRRSPTLPEFVR
jgi:hypothetical protein